MKNIICVVWLIIFGTVEVSLAQVVRSTTFDEREMCEKGGGVWRQFGNGCVDSCRSQLDRFSMCTMALTYGCDCGSNGCFDNDKCVKNSEFKEAFDAEQEIEKEEQDEQKEARKDEFRKMRNVILNDLNKTKDTADKKQNDVVKGNQNSSQSEPNNNLAQFRNNNNNRTGSSPIVNVITKPVFEKNNQNHDPETVAPVKQKFQIPSFFLKNKNNDAKKDESNLVKTNQKDNVTSPDVEGDSVDDGLPKIPLPN
ncbi:MAG: hypothetical protein KGQ36_06950 [Rickettsiales bacterium]|nr:hypothetical protein [Rickettsiales bacterium]